jgi:chromosome partitioning protein
VSTSPDIGPGSWTDPPLGRAADPRVLSSATPVSNPWVPSDPGDVGTTGAPSTAAGPGHTGVPELPVDPGGSLTDTDGGAAVAEPIPGPIAPPAPHEVVVVEEVEAAEAAPVASVPPTVPVGPTGRPVRSFPVPAPVLEHGPARVIAVCNQKGGVGKTTSTINLGAALAEYGRRVLLVDLDPQGAATVGVGVDPFELGDNTIYRLLKDLSVAPSEVLLKTDVAGLDLLPANIDLSVAEVELVTEIARERRLAEVLAPLVDDYDVVLIDCQPSLGLLTINALVAAHSVLIPTECEYYALRGVSLLMESIHKVRRAINPSLEIEGFLATMYDGRTLHSREVLALLVASFPDDVLETVISRTVRFPESTVSGRPITSYASASSGAEAYRQLAREVLSR